MKKTKIYIKNRKQKGDTRHENEIQGNVALVSEKDTSVNHEVFTKFSPAGSIAEIREWQEREGKRVLRERV